MMPVKTVIDAQVPLSASQIAQLLSPREFFLICKFFDYLKSCDPTKANASGQFMGGDLGRSSNQVPVQMLAPRCLTSQFTIYDIRCIPDPNGRESRLFVLCKGEDDQMLDLDCGCRNQKVVSISSRVKGEPCRLPG